MKNLLNSMLLSGLLFTTMANAQWFSKNTIKGNGKIVTEKRSTANYDQIRVGGFFDVELVSGKEGAITIVGEENILPLVRIEVENGVLLIYTEKNKSINTSKKLLITVPFESISDVSLGGSGSITTKSTIKTTKFSVKLSGSGDINLTLDVNDAEVNISGSGDVNLKGKATNYDGKLSGSGDLNTYELNAENANAVISGSGNIQLFCSNNLIARISGSGSINYKGNPKTKDTKVSGSGSISAK
ncbi:head GIN domain-containing protein [Flavobacterium sp. PL002]|uniref:head GIN domain-containing protein n=1 Tax=Flavobacterium sp. PL002 TaxID=1897058 RepID=UPI001787BE1C|nr:head GIN domain-containing protein [Flavobacterium sp. PL002]MBE0392339.1 hypothetical protein [Flavobacterium sp. PL002]